MFVVQIYPGPDLNLARHRLPWSYDSVYSISYRCLIGTPQFEVGILTILEILALNGQKYVWWSEPENILFEKLHACQRWSP